MEVERLLFLFSFEKSNIKKLGLFIDPIKICKLIDLNCKRMINEIFTLKYTILCILYKHV